MTRPTTVQQYTLQAHYDSSPSRDAMQLGSQNDGTGHTGNQPIRADFQKVAQVDKFGSGTITAQCSKPRTPADMKGLYVSCCACQRSHAK
jgi:hypothetical protein